MDNVRNPLDLIHQPWLTPVRNHPFPAHDLWESNIKTKLKKVEDLTDIFTPITVSPTPYPVADLEQFM